MPVCVRGKQAIGALAGVLDYAQGHIDDETELNAPHLVERHGNSS